MGPRGEEGGWKGGEGGNCLGDLLSVATARKAVGDKTFVPNREGSQARRTEAVWRRGQEEEEEEDKEEEKWGRSSHLHHSLQVSIISCDGGECDGGEEEGGPGSQPAIPCPPLLASARHLWPNTNSKRVPVGGTGFIHPTLPCPAAPEAGSRPARTPSSAAKKLRMKTEYLREAQDSLRRAKELQSEREVWFRDLSNAASTPPTRRDGTGTHRTRSEEAESKRRGDGWESGGGAEMTRVNPMMVSIAFMVFVLLAAIVAQNRISTDFLSRERGECNKRVQKAESSCRHDLGGVSPSLAPPPLIFFLPCIIIIIIMITMIMRVSAAQDLVCVRIPWPVLPGVGRLGFRGWGWGV